MTSDRLDRLEIVTGEFAPSPGGVGDHSARLASALAEAGVAVGIWTGDPSTGPTPPEPKRDIHRVAGRWDRAGLTRLSAALDARPAPRRLFVQYAPNAYGRRGMNLGFCSWLLERRRRGDDVNILFHEVRYLVRPEDGLRRRALATVQRLMVRRLLRAANRVYVTIPYWNELLRPHAPRGFVSTWLPVPSNIPAVNDPEAVAALRTKFAPDDERVVGCFGTFQDVIGSMVAETLPPLILAKPNRVGLLIGRGSEAFAAGLKTARPELVGRLIAVGGLEAEDVSRHLQACDLLVQPYPDGVCSKRGSVMAGLANGIATFTTLGRISEPIWHASGAVATKSDLDLDALVGLADRLVDEPVILRRLGNLGLDLYRREFDLKRMVERLTASLREPS